MAKVELNIMRVLLLILYLKYVKLVPHKYCLSPLNMSDCGKQPTAVFSYFKTGSRCEIETWRGCPTANMFENEYHCSYYCIGNLKYYGRGKGSWEGRLSQSIGDLSIKELKALDVLLHNADNILDDDDDDGYENIYEILKNTSPMRPKLIEDDSKHKLNKKMTCHTRETTVDGFTNTENSSDSATTEDTETTRDDTELTKADIEEISTTYRKPLSRIPMYRNSTSRFSENTVVRL